MKCGGGACQSLQVPLHQLRWSPSPRKLGEECLTAESAWGILCDGFSGVGHGYGSNARAQA